MTASSATSNDLLEKHDIVDTVETEKRPPAAETTADAFESPLQQAIQAGEWSSTEDPEDPLNWSTAKKTYNSAIPSVYCFTVYVQFCYSFGLLLHGVCERYSCEMVKLMLH